MPYRIAGIDVHKKMLAVVVCDVAAGGEFVFVRNKFGTTGSELDRLAEWLLESDVAEVAMESTAQYWKPVWFALERSWQAEARAGENSAQAGRKLHLAQAQSNRAPQGRKNDFGDAERLVKRLVAGELRLSYVPDAKQRLWRALSRRKYQLTCDKVCEQNRLEGLLEEAQIKLSSLVSDLLGVSARRMLNALADGEKDSAALASLAHPKLRANPTALRDALRAAEDLDETYRKLLRMHLNQILTMEQQIEEVDRCLSAYLQPHAAEVKRLAEVPGLGADSAQQIIGEIGPAAAAFASSKALASWVGVCPGREESAGVSESDRSPKGNRTLRRLLTQAANAAVKKKGSIFELKYRRMVTSKGHLKAIWAIAHFLCTLVWIVLHRGEQYVERGPEVHDRLAKRRADRLVRELRRMGYHVEPAKAVA